MTCKPNLEAGQYPPAPPIDLWEALYTTRSMRRLRSDPVPVETLARIVEAATMAPSGVDGQHWRFVVVTDRALVRRIAGLWATLYDTARPQAEAMLPPAMFRSIDHLAQNMAEVPAVIVVGGTGAPAPSAPRIAVATWYGSLFPAVQNLLLAARSHGLGATLTTFLLPLEAQLRELLLIPEDVSLVACIPMGYPAGRFGRPARQPVEEVAHLNQFGTPLPNPRW
jgi:nitroreductase